MGGLFSLITSVAGIGFEFAGQQKLMKSEEQSAAISASIASFQAQGQAVQYSLYSTMQQRASQEALRRGQQANAANFQTQLNQGANQFSSAYGGARGQTGGEVSTAISGISENRDAAQTMFGLNQQIDQLKIQQAMIGAQEAQAQGQISLGGDIMSIGKSFGNVFGGLGTPSSGGGGAGNFGNFNFGLPVGMLG
jgi:hypothetical protein